MDNEQLPTYSEKPTAINDNKTLANPKTSTNVNDGKEKQYSSAFSKEKEKYWEDLLQQFRQ